MDQIQFVSHGYLHLVRPDLPLEPFRDNILSSRISEIWWRFNT